MSRVDRWRVHADTRGSKVGSSKGRVWRQNKLQHLPWSSKLSTRSSAARVVVGGTAAAGAVHAWAATWAGVVFDRACSGVSDRVKLMFCKACCKCNGRAASANRGRRRECLKSTRVQRG